MLKSLFNKLEQLSVDLRKTHPVDFFKCCSEMFLVWPFFVFLLRLGKKRCFFKTHFPSLKYACIFLCTCVYTCYIFIFMLDLSSWDFKVIDEMDYLTPRDMNIKWITIWKWSLFSYRDEIFFYCVLTSKTESTYGSKTVITIVICFCK